MMARSVTMAFVLQVCTVAGSFLSRGVQDEKKLPEVREVVAKPVEVLNHLRTGVGELAEQLNAAEDMTTKAVSKKKEEFEMKLEQQKQEIVGIGMTNAVISQRISDLRSSSDILRLQANQLLKENKELKQKMVRLQANMTTAQDFSDIALASAKAKLDNATELTVLRQLDEEDAARAENASRYRALQEIHFASKKMAMLEFGAGPSSSPQEMLQTLMSTLTSLADAENSSLMSLQNQFDEQFQEGVKKYNQLIADQAKLNSTWANESETNSRLVVAVNHLKDTQVHVKKDLESVRLYVQKLVSLSSGKTGVSTSPAAGDITVPVPNTRDFAIEKFHASQKAAFAEKQEHNAKADAAKKALAKKGSTHATKLLKHSKAEAAKEAIEKALAEEKAKRAAADARTKTQDCHDACYNDRHKDVPWSSHKCLWKNCHECAECAQAATESLRVLAKDVYTLHQKKTKSFAKDMKVNATSKTEDQVSAENHGAMAAVKTANATKGILDEESKKKILQKLLKKAKKLQAKNESRIPKLEDEVKNVVAVPKTGTAAKANREIEEELGKKAERTAKRISARAETKGKEREHKAATKATKKLQGQSMEAKKTDSPKKQAKAIKKAADVKHVEKHTKSEKESERHELKHIKEATAGKLPSQTLKAAKASKTGTSKHVEKSTSVMEASASPGTVAKSSKASWFSWLMR